MTINDCKLIELPKFLDERGNLSFAENNNQIPFTIRRTYWLYDVPGGVARGGHAEINNEELINYILAEKNTVREVGDALTNRLRQNGIQVIHDKTIHDNLYKIFEL